MAEEEWIKVFETTQLHRAMIVQSILKEHEIESVLLNQKDSAYITLGEVSVMVRADQAADALVIIDQEIQ